MAVALRGSITTASSSTSVSSIAAPTGLTSGDVILIWLTSNVGPTPSVTGFTAVPQTSLADHESLFWRVADGTEGSTFSITSGGTSGAAAVCAAFSGAAGGTTPFDPNNPVHSAAHFGAGTSPTIAGFENVSSEATVANGDMMIWLLDAFFLSGSITVTYPTGFTGVTAQNASGGLAAGIAYKSQTTAGTGGTQAGSFTGGSSQSWATQMVAITAGAGGGSSSYVPRQFRPSFVPHIRASNW